MSTFGNTQADNDLIRSLADGLVTREVIEPMDAIGWSHAAPGAPVAVPVDNPQGGEAPNPAVTPSAPNVQPDNPAAAASTTVAPSGEAKTDVPANGIDWESLRDPNGMYLGKYRTPQEAARGIGHAVNMAKQAFVERDQARQEVATLRQQIPVQPLPTTQTVSVPVTQTLDLASLAKGVKSERLSKVLTDVVENGGVLDEESKNELLAGISEHAASVALSTVEEQRRIEREENARQTQRWTAVDRYMEEKYPGASAHVDELDLFIKSQPLVAKAVQALSASGDDLAAAEFAWVEYDKSVKSTNASVTQVVNAQAEEAGLARQQVRKEVVDAARKDAGVLSTVAGGVHEQVNNTPSRDEVDSAIQEMNRTGLGSRWRGLTIGRDLTGPLFD